MKNSDVLLFAVLFVCGIDVALGRRWLAEVVFIAVGMLFLVMVTVLPTGFVATTVTSSCL